LALPLDVGGREICFGKYLIRQHRGYFSALRSCSKKSRRLSVPVLSPASAKCL
jgi:hypothetical protein